MIHLMRRKRRVADGRSIPNRAAVFLTRSCDWARWRYFGRRGAGTGRVAERASRRESATRPALIFDELATMPRVLRSEAHADALREWTLAEACYSWSRYVASDNDATSAAGPDDECPCAGAARNEEYLVSCDPVRLTPPPAAPPPARSPPDPPRTSPRRSRRHFSRAIVTLFLSRRATPRRSDDATRARPPPSLRPRPFAPVPSDETLTPGTRPPSPRTSPHPGGDWIPPPRDAVFLAPALRPTTRHLFVVAFACIIAACVASLAVVHRWWRREAAALEAERAARAAASNPWNMRALARTAPRGAASRRDSAGASLEGSCTVCTC